MSVGCRPRVLDARKLIDQVAFLCEKAFRRGFHHGFWVRSGEYDLPIPKKSEVAQWRVKYVWGDHRDAEFPPGMGRGGFTAFRRLQIESLEKLRELHDLFEAGKVIPLPHVKKASAGGSFRPTMGVYALGDPRTSRIMYVGQSIDIEFRYRQHCDLRKRFDQNNLEKAYWISELVKEGLRPELFILQECSWSEIDEAERRWIRVYKSQHQAELNITSGGSSRGISNFANTPADDWYQLGLKIKRARLLLSEIWSDLSRLSNAKHVDSFRGVGDKLDRFTRELEDQLADTYPEWEVWRLFHGDEESEGPDA